MGPGSTPSPLGAVALAREVEAGKTEVGLEGRIWSGKHPEHLGQVGVGSPSGVPAGFGACGRGGQEYRGSTLLEEGSKQIQK